MDQPNNPGELELEFGAGNELPPLSSLSMPAVPALGLITARADAGRQDSYVCPKIGMQGRES